MEETTHIDCQVVMLPALIAEIGCPVVINGGEMLVANDTDAYVINNKLNTLFQVPQHVYFVSRGKIALDDWVYERNLSPDRIYRVYERNDMLGIFRFRNVFVPLEKTGCMRVEATTDESLIVKLDTAMEWDYPNRVPADFVREYVKTLGMIDTVRLETYRRGKNSPGADADLTGGLILHKDDYYGVKTDDSRAVTILARAPKKYTEEDVVHILKAFRLDTVQDWYSKELIDWCNKCIEENNKNPI